MSFSSLVKNELCRIELPDNCCLLTELAAIMRISGTVKPSGREEANIRLITENAAFARRVFTSIKKLFNINSEVLIRKSKKLKKHVSYNIIIADSKKVGQLLKAVGMGSGVGNRVEEEHCCPELKHLLKKACCRKAYLRGAFLASGSVSDPEKTYHLEIINHSMESALELNRIMNGYELNTKMIERKGSYVTYLKEGENIVDFLNIIGAHKALMEFENIRILKEMRNNVNRIVNCETANLEKTVNASVRQIENIKFIRDRMGFDNLPENLREIAEIRLSYSDANLKELGEMLNPPLGKSGVNHRLRKLDKIAENERGTVNGGKSC